MTEQDKGQTRYRLLETIKQYAADRLEENGEIHAVGDRHREFFVSFA